MTPEQQNALELRVRRAYELARLHAALLDSVPMLAVVATAAAVGGVWLGLAAAPLLLGVGIFSLWYGREAARGVLPGALSGGLALFVTLAATHLHACSGTRCLTWCLPACVASGVLGGAFVSLIGLRQQRRAGYWLSAAAVTLLTFSVGCRCVGVPGVLGAALGFGAVLTVAGVTVSRRHALSRG